MDELLRHDTIIREQKPAARWAGFYLLNSQRSIRSISAIV